MQNERLPWWILAFLPLLPFYCPLALCWIEKWNLILSCSELSGLEYSRRNFKTTIVLLEVTWREYNVQAESTNWGHTDGAVGTKKMHHKVNMACIASLRHSRKCSDPNATKWKVTRWSFCATGPAWEQIFTIAFPFWQWIPWHLQLYRVPIEIPFGLGSCRAGNELSVHWEQVLK